MMNEQICRIQRMERLMDEARTLLEKESLTEQEMQALHALMKTLDEYYSSPLWRKDYEDDENGLLPRDLKRGILSEDGLWNLLTDYTWLTQE